MIVSKVLYLQAPPSLLTMTFKRPLSSGLAEGVEGLRNLIQPKAVREESARLQTA
jgi:hypothetical protein